MRQPSSPRRTLLRPLLVFGLILSLVSVLPVSAARLQAPDDGSYQTPPFSQNWTNTQPLGICRRHAPASFAGLPDTKKPCLLYTSPSPRDRTRSRMPSSA